ncbi:hypothetical protein ONZ45_g15737 [Pleurotus djamor]|nr:hypothetical protein ONZ45_g15737 [Pleurotus djamor]
MSRGKAKTRDSIRPSTVVGQARIKRRRVDDDSDDNGDGDDGDDEVQSANTNKRRRQSKRGVGKGKGREKCHPEDDEDAVIPRMDPLSDSSGFNDDGMEYPDDDYTQGRKATQRRSQPASVVDGAKRSSGKALPSEKGRPKPRPIKKTPADVGLEPCLDPSKQQTSEVLEKNKPLLSRDTISRQPLPRPGVPRLSGPAHHQPITEPVLRAPMEGSKRLSGPAHHQPIAEPVLHLSLYRARVHHVQMVLLTTSPSPSQYYVRQWKGLKQLFIHVHTLLTREIILTHLSTTYIHPSLKARAHNTIPASSVVLVRVLTHTNRPTSRMPLPLLATQPLSPTDIVHWHHHTPAIATISTSPQATTVILTLKHHVPLHSKASANKLSAVKKKGPNPNFQQQKQKNNADQTGDSSGQKQAQSPQSDSNQQPKRKRGKRAGKNQNNAAVDVADVEVINFANAVATPTVHLPSSHTLLDRIDTSSSSAPIVVGETTTIVGLPVMPKPKWFNHKHKEVAPQQYNGQAKPSNCKSIGDDNLAKACSLVSRIAEQPATTETLRRLHGVFQRQSTSSTPPADVSDDESDDDEDDRASKRFRSESPEDLRFRASSLEDRLRSPSPEPLDDDSDSLFDELETGYQNESVLYSEGPAPM